MKINYPHAQKFHYLTVAGKCVTPNINVVAAGAITGALTTTTITDWISTPNRGELAINVTVQRLVGISPSLDVFLDVLDPIESNNSNANPSQNLPLVSIKLTQASSITSITNLRAVISNGQLTSGKEIRQLRFSGILQCSTCSRFGSVLSSLRQLRQSFLRSCTSSRTNFNQKITFFDNLS